MSWADFEVLPRKPGWKYEYWDGHVRLSPRHITAIASLELKPCPVQAVARLRPVTTEDTAKLVVAYVASFRDSVEYCDDTPAQVEAAARENLTGFFAGARGLPLPASRVAIGGARDERAGDVAGAALIVAGTDGIPHLDLLFVVPRWQRRGLATALVAAAGNELHRTGATVLRSRYHLGNEASRTWHRRVGVVEEPDLTLAQVHLRSAEHELWRREKIGDLGAHERARLIAERDRWRTAAEQLANVAGRRSGRP